MFRRSLLLMIALLFVLPLSAEDSFMDSGSSAYIIQIRENLIEDLKGDFSATFQSTPVKDVFRIFAVQSGLNIMVSPNIKDTITANFNKVSIKDALLAILSANNLYYIVQGNIVKIMTVREYRNELFRKNVITKSYDASIIDVNNLGTVLKPILSPGVGTFSVDKQSSKIIILDVADNFDRLDKLFNELSSLPKMVEIETKILEIELNDGNETGIDWSALNIGQAVDVNFKFSPSGGVADEMLKVSGKANLDGINLETLFSVISKKYKTKLVSQPKVLAVNREEATIHIGSKVPFIKSVINNPTTAQSTSQVEFIDVGIKLVVTPMVTPEDDIRLSIQAESSSYQFVAITSTENAPKIITTEIKCDSVTKNNQTIIIGGLIKSESTMDKKGVPFLKDIPFLDLFFGHNKDTFDRSEMVIFLTPRVIRDGKSNISLKNNSEEILKEALGAADTTNQVTNK